MVLNCPDSPNNSIMWKENSREGVAMRNTVCESDREGERRDRELKERQSRIF